MRMYKREQFIGVAIFALLTVHCVAYGELTQNAEPRSQKSVIMVPMPTEDCWQDFAFLAAVPASAKLNRGTPVVLALETNAAFRPETSDYLARYKPDSLYMLDCKSHPENEKEVSGANTTIIAAKDLDSAVCSLASRFWTAAETAACCSVSNYEDAVIASTLAARLQVPLIFSGKDGLTQAAIETLKALDTKKLIFIGKDVPQSRGFEVQHLSTAYDVLRWMQKEKMPIGYLAAFNPIDRTAGWVRKISLAAPLLAAGRNGMVAPLDFDPQWKVPFNTIDPEAGQNKGGKASVQARQGTIEINGAQATFVMTCSDRKHDKTACMENWAEGKCPRQMSLVNRDGSLQGPYVAGDRIKLGDKYYTLSLDPESGIGKADLWLTWPGVPEINERLAGYYRVIGGHPEYLCLLGWPDVLPTAVLTHQGGRTDITSDQPFANVDDDPFIEIALGRLIGEDVYSAVLTAVRGLTYEDLKTGDWPSRFGLAGWGDSDRALENVGFTMVPYHNANSTNKHINTRIRQHSPLTEVATIKHGAHSGWRSFGGFYGNKEAVLMAPSVIESAGCSTMRIDQNPEGRTAPARLLRNGAVCVLGNARNGRAEQNLYRSELWSGLLQDMSVGMAHRYALNRALLAVLDTGQENDGGFRYEFYIRTLYGDPAIHMALPHAPSSRPAWTEVSGTKVTAHAPQTWWERSSQPSAAWQCKHDILHYINGAGVGSQSQWNPAQRCELTKHYYTVELNTKEIYLVWTDTQGQKLEAALEGINENVVSLRERNGKITQTRLSSLSAESRNYIAALAGNSPELKGNSVIAIEQTEKLQDPLGWNGKYWVDEHQDGSRSFFWRVSFLDYDQFTGTFRSRANSISFTLSSVK